MYNTLVAGGDTNADNAPFPPSPRLQTTELTRSSPVGRSTGQYYIGNFEWLTPTNPSDLALTLYQPAPDTYPYTIGHFREFKSAADFHVADGAPYNLASDPCTGTSACNWDTAALMQPWANRNIYMVNSSNQLVDVHPLAGATVDKAIHFISLALGNGLLGGVDYATAAVIEPKKGPTAPADAAGRPTIAYVGARDGMLHAICVKPGTSDGTSPNCYGAYQPGQEIWAIIPYGTKQQMDWAYANSDWSNVNVGGAARVADMYVAGKNRTILIIGTREGPQDLYPLTAFDISNPNPSLLNADDFKVMWKSNGLTGAGPLQMGPTNGATIVQTDKIANTGVVVATTGTAAGAGPGINTYVLSMADGSVISSDQRIYATSGCGGSGCRFSLAGLSNGPIPNDPPPLPTVLNTDNSGEDETLIIADSTGAVRLFKLAATAPYGITGTPLVFDAGIQAGCAAGYSCQPINAPPSIVKHTDGTFGVLVGTGGTDWARQTPTSNYYLMGFDPKTAARSFSPIALGSVSPPSPQPANQPIRVYSQPVITGSDLYVQGTSLAVGNINQLIYPAMFPGPYGKVLRLNNANTTSISIDPTEPTYGTSFSGGNAYILEINNIGGGGTVYMVGTNQVVRQVAIPASSLANSTFSVQPAVTGGGPFSVNGWLDLN